MLQQVVNPHVMELREAFTKLREEGRAPTVMYPTGLYEGGTVLCLPLPPSLNTAFPTFNGRRVKSAAYKSWLAECEWYVKEESPHEKYPPGTYWGLTTYFFFNNWRSDMDNRYKILIDFLCQRLGVQDNYLLEHYSRRFNVKTPKYGVGVTGVIAVVSKWGV